MLDPSPDPPVHGQSQVDPGLAIDRAVVAVARLRLAGCDHEAGVGVDRDLQVHRVPVVLAGRRHPMITGRYESAIHDGDLVDASLRTGANASNGP